jgi:exosome complex exonuclease RRP6
LERILQELQLCPLLAVDLEYHNVLPGNDSCTIISLIQLSTIHSDYIIDCFMLRDTLRSENGELSIRTIFANEKIVKIMHGCDTDLKYLVADFGVTTANVFDTARGFSFLQRIPHKETILKQKIISISKHIDYLSLEKLTKLAIDVNLDKFFQVADWRIRPLPAGMLDYARCDSHYLIPIYLLLISIISGNFDIHIPETVRELSSSSKNDFLANLRDVYSDDMSELMKE